MYTVYKISIVDMVLYDMQVWCGRVFFWKSLIHIKMFGVGIIYSRER